MEEKKLLILTCSEKYTSSIYDRQGFSILSVDICRVHNEFTYRNHTPYNKEHLALITTHRNAIPVCVFFFIAIQIRIDITNPNGDMLQHYRDFVTLDGSSGESVIPFAFNDTPGTWIIQATDVATAVSTEKKVISK